MRDIPTASRLSSNDAMTLRFCCANYACVAIEPQIESTREKRESAREEKRESARREERERARQRASEFSRDPSTITESACEVS